MPWGSVILKPGVDVELTPTLNTAGYSESSLIRFKSNLAQKVGGWTRYYPFAVGGIPRSLHAWRDLNEDDFLAVGTTTSLGAISGNNLYAITPQQLTTNETPDFSTTNGSATVTVVDVGISNVTTYDSIEFKTPVSVGGIILSGVYPIDIILSSTSYRITAFTEATSTVANGGAVPAFATTSGSASVDVTLVAHGLSAGSTITFPIPTTGGGVTISGTYRVTSVTSASVFVIALDAAASSSTTFSMNAGEARIQYEIALGPIEAGGSGYGTGTYGSGSYGTGATSSAQTGTAITATDWSHDNWGSTLLSCPEGGGIYEWTPGTGFVTAKFLSGAPPYNGGIFVAAPAQILIAWGSTEYQTIGVDQDPLSYSWSDQLDYTFWEAGVVNPATGVFSQAGSNRIPTGSRIVAGVQAPQQALLWTDIDLWAINYIGNPTIGTFGQTKISSSCGAIGSHCVGQLGNTVMWMGRSNFFAFSGGGVSPMPCSVWDAVFQDLDVDNAWKVRAAPNTPFNEMWWFYPSISGGTGENDSYVKVNITDGAWDYGPINALQRSAWIDQSVLGMPIGASPEGLIYQHETGEDADGQPIQWSFKTGYWMIAEGEDVAIVDFVVPDFRFGLWNGANDAVVQITLYSVMSPGDSNEIEHGPYTVTSGTQSISTRLRGRQMAIKVSGSDLGSFARLGRVRYRWAPSGRFGG